jgi:hypothetical protein
MNINSNSLEHQIRLLMDTATQGLSEDARKAALELMEWAINPSEMAKKSVTIETPEAYASFILTVYEVIQSFAASYRTVDKPVANKSAI